MALSQSRFRSKIGAKSTFLPSAKLPMVNRANQGVVSGFKQMTWSGAVFTIIFGTKKINNTFYQQKRKSWMPPFLILIHHERVKRIFLLLQFELMNSNVNQAYYYSSN